MSASGGMTYPGTPSESQAGQPQYCGGDDHPDKRVMHVIWAF
jgi:hypothetical protein